MSAGARHMILLFFLNFALEFVGSYKCDRTPEGHIAPKTPADNRFRLKISGNPDKYVPGEGYTVSIHGTRSNQHIQTFSGFNLVVGPTGHRSKSLLDSHKHHVGSFQLYGDALTKFSEDCPNMVRETSPIGKGEIQVRWNAPPTSSGCVIFRATVVEGKDVWYQDDGPLSKILCEDVQENHDEQPIALEICCACDEAKYEVTFEGLWSRHTHPKDFPSNSWSTKFSDVIGASHTTKYRFWEYGGIASEGLRQVAERGATRILESELKSQSSNIRTIIKARGIGYPNVTGKTFAVFRVDRKHHLMSLVSMIVPSPDWIVGVAGLELCLDNCSWVESKVLNLYPWDAGTDSGVTYISPDQQTVPRDNIRRITPTFPADIRSPFYDKSGTPMKPLARLYLTRQRLYEKSCVDSSDEDEIHDNEACSVTEWGEWDKCSVTCGIGSRTRQRFYKYLNRAENCKKSLSNRESCYGSGACGPITTETTQDPRCVMTEWSNWSACSTSCGIGKRVRYRKFLIPKYSKHCMANRPRFQETLSCNAPFNDLCPTEDVLTYGMELENDALSNCEIWEWSEWSPCSVTCGIGVKVRTRRVLRRFDLDIRDQDDLDDNTDISSDDVNCPGVPAREEVPCLAEIDTCDLSANQAKEVCQLPKDVGPCRTQIEKWFFDMTTQECKKFGWSCRGNRNRFDSLEECLHTCQSLRETETADQETTTLSHHIISINSQVSNNPVDCKTSRWSTWSTCSSTCGIGYKHKYRSIKIYPQNGGKPCPKKLTRNKKCQIPPCDYEEESIENQYGNKERKGCVYMNWSPWSHCTTTCGLEAFRQRTRAVDLSQSLPEELCNDRVRREQCHVQLCH